jgi:hypothetical protein
MIGAPAGRADVVLASTATCPSPRTGIRLARSCYGCSSRHRMVLFLLVRDQPSGVASWVSHAPLRWPPVAIPRSPTARPPAGVAQSARRAPGDRTLAHRPLAPAFPGSALVAIGVAGASIIQTIAQQEYDCAPGAAPVIARVAKRSPALGPTQHSLVARAIAGLALAREAKRSRERPGRTLEALRRPF